MKTRNSKDSVTLTKESASYFLNGKSKKKWEGEEGE